MPQVQVIGHRGARAYAPESTLPAFKVGLSQGIDVVDVDVVVTKDQELIGYHDLLINPNILQDVNGNYLANSKTDLLQQFSPTELESILIKNLTLAELKSYNVKLNPNSDYSKWFPQQQSIANTKLATLDEIVDYTNKITNKTIEFQFEIKNDFDHPNWSYTPKQLADFMYAFLCEHDLILRSKIQAFDWRILIELTKLDPRIKTAYLASYLFRTNWQRWFANSVIVEQVKAMGLFEDSALIPLIKACGGYSYEPEDNELTKENLDLAHSYGLKVIVWGWPEHSKTAFNPQLMNKLLDWGIDGIITDDPIALNQILAKCGYNLPRKFS